MKKLFEKVIRRVFNKLFQIYNGIPYSTYKATLTNRSFDSMSSALLWMIHGVKKQYPEFTLEKRIVLEIGSGQFLSHPLGLKLLGAIKIISLDLYKQYNQKAAQLSYSKQVMAKKIFSSYAESNNYHKTLEDIKNTNLDLNLLSKLGINYLAPYDLHDYNENNSIDFIISYTVLEHVPPEDIVLLLKKSIALLKSEGHFCHFIDLEDHKDSDNNPFEFLRYKNWGSSDCFSRGNRLRLNDWREIFDQMENIEYTFVSILERNEELLPEGIKKELNNYVSGILVVGKKTSND